MDNIENSIDPIAYACAVNAAERTLRGEGDYTQADVAAYHAYVDFGGEAHSDTAILSAKKAATEAALNIAG